MKSVLFNIVLLVFCLLVAGVFLLNFIGGDTMGPLGIPLHIWWAVIGFSALGISLFALGAVERSARRRSQRRLLERRQLDDSAFGREYFGRSSKEKTLAIELRRLLAENLQRDLGGLSPDDRLDEDVDADLINKPELFLEIESHYGLNTHVEDDLDSHMALCKSLVTFRHLVEYVQSRVDSEDQ